MTRFLPQHLEAFAAIPYSPQPPYGKAPSKWAQMMGLVDEAGLEVAKLPDQQLTRDQVREQCRAPHSLIHGYVVAMSWGDQGAGAGGTKHALAAWAERETIVKLLGELRKGKLSVRESYDLFANTPVKGLGPAYFTKLLYFFRAGAEHGQPVDRYVMDKWTAKSINMLTGEHIVRVNKEGNVEASNTGENYEAFCQEIERLAAELNARKLGRQHTGEDVEQMLFSLGSIKKKPQWPWRVHVDTNWDGARPTHPYDHKRVRARIHPGDAPTHG